MQIARSPALRSPAGATSSEAEAVGQIDPPVASDDKDKHTEKLLQALKDARRAAFQDEYGAKPTGPEPTRCGMQAER